MAADKKCAACDKPRGFGCPKYCVDCSIAYGKRKPEKPVCERCHGPKPRGVGRQYCDECRDLEKWKRKRLHAIHRRKTCSDCGGPKPPGSGRVRCPACVKGRREKVAVKAVRTCPDCGVNPVGTNRIYCEDCRELRARQSQDRRNAKMRMWRANTPPSKRRKAKAKAKPEPMVPVLQLGEALHRLGMRMAGIRLADTVESATCGHKEVCERAGIMERTAFGWRCGERDNTELRNAADVMSRVDLLWWDVWNTDTVRRHAFRATVYKNAKPDPTVSLGPLNAETFVQWNEHPKRMSPVGFKRVKLESTRYVDLGPDKVELRKIARKFEGSKPRRAAA